MKIKTKLCIILILLAAILALSYVLINSDKETEVKEEIKENIEENKEEHKEEVMVDNTYSSYKNINDDYVGIIEFESGIISLPFVQAKGNLDDYKFYSYNGKTVKDYENDCEGGPCCLNDVYLRKDWISGEYDLGGSIFMESLNVLNDQNIILYGHMFPVSMDKERKLSFSPLELLLDKNNYETNKKIKIELENEIREYEVVYVYLFNITNDDYNNLQYYRTNYNYDYNNQYDETSYKTYIDNVEKVKLYDTGLSLSTNDNTLTLQTCYNGNSNLREIVVARMCSTTKKD